MVRSRVLGQVGIRSLVLDRGWGWGQKLRFEELGSHPILRSEVGSQIGVGVGVKSRDWVQG